ncbi:MAG TPA: hypothetical protein PLC35_00345 [Methanosarcina vacuolata]|nr:hypothetical protein [Methanosarcina vacuolata]
MEFSKTPDSLGTIINFEYPEKGTLNYETRMLIAPLAGGKEPTVPGKVKFGGKTFDISNIRTLRSMKGDLLGYRIAL